MHSAPELAAIPPLRRRALALAAPIRLTGLLTSCICALVLSSAPVPAQATPPVAGSRTAAGQLPTQLSNQLSRQSPSATVGVATWSATRWQAGERYAVTGSVRVQPSPATVVTPEADRLVMLEAQTASGWVEIGQTTTGSDGSFALTGRLEWYGAHQLRLQAPATLEAAATTFGRTRVVVQPGYRPRGSARDYSIMRNTGWRLRMNPCEPIDYQVNARHAGAGAVPLVKRALREVGRATGMTFRYAGRSSQIALGSSSLPEGTELLISWATERQRPRLRGAVAVSSMVTGSPSRDAAGRVWRVTATGVTVNANLTQSGSHVVDLSMSSARRPTLGMVIMHEVGHAVGLAHVSQREELMFFSTGMPRWSDGVYHARYAAGDLAGLRSVGLAGGCVG